MPKLPMAILRWSPALTHVSRVWQCQSRTLHPLISRYGPLHPGLFESFGWLWCKSLTSSPQTTLHMESVEVEQRGTFWRRPPWTQHCKAVGAAAALPSNTLTRERWQWPVSCDRHNVDVSSNGPSREPCISGVFARKKRWDMGGDWGVSNFLWFAPRSFRFP